jgi:hypothetical protein
MPMTEDHSDLDRMQLAYKAAVDSWVALIRAEEELASVHHTVAEVDAWEGAHFAAEAARLKVEEAKSAYERALRERFYGFG